MGWLSDLWFVCDRTVPFWYKGPVQTSNFSCAEPNCQIRHMKSSTYESIRFVDTRARASTDLYLGRPASRIDLFVLERQKLDNDSDVEPPHMPNLICILIFPISQQRLWLAVRSLMTVPFSKWRFKLKHVGTGPLAQNGQLTLSSIYIFIPYWVLVPQYDRDFLEHRKGYSDLVSINVKPRGYNKLLKRNGMKINRLSVHFHIFKRWQ